MCNNFNSMPLPLPGAFQSFVRSQSLSICLCIYLSVYLSVRLSDKKPTGGGSAEVEHILPNGRGRGKTVDFRAVLVVLFDLQRFALLLLLPLLLQ